MSRGRGRLSRSSWVGEVSSSSMISLQRSMHSSQMYTPGPAINFLTCRWLFPQKLQRSCSFPSLALATVLSLYLGSRFSSTGGRRRCRRSRIPWPLLRSCSSRAPCPRDLFDRLIRVLTDDLLQAALEV